MQGCFENKMAIASLLVFWLGCAANAAPLQEVTLPNRDVLGYTPSPLGDGPMSQAAAQSSERANWSGTIDNLANTLAQRLRWDGRNRMKVAVLDFVEAHGRECSLGAPAAEDLTTSLFSTNKFEIIERRMLARVLEENQASQSDLYDPEHVARLGGLLGADGIVTGTVVASAHDYDFNSRVILAESGGIASAARRTMRRAEADGRGTCGDGRQVIAAPPLSE
jgi:TolB-like protein